MKTKVIKGGILIDVIAKKTVEDPVIKIEDKKITAVGKKDDFNIPENAEIIDASGKTVMPGLIDSHVHIYTDGESGDFNSMPVVYNPLALAMKSVPRLKRILEMGITSLGDGGSGWGWLEVALRDAINRGDIIGPRFFATGYHLSVTGGHGYFLPPWLANIPVHPEQSTIHCDGPDEWRKAARLNIYNGTDAIKVVCSRDIISPGNALAPQATLEEITAAIEEAHKMGKRALAHAQGPVAIKNAIKAGATNIVHGFFIDEECADMMVKNNVFLEPTSYYIKAILEKGRGILPDWMVEKAISSWDQQKKTFKMCLDKGVKIAFGSDAGVPFISQGDNAHELRMFVELGMTPMEAIYAGTMVSAESLRINNITGSVEVGKMADIILVDGDPLKDITLLTMPEKIKMVLKEGKIVKVR